MADEKPRPPLETLKTVIGASRLFSRMLSCLKRDEISRVMVMGKRLSFLFSSIITSSLEAAGLTASVSCPTLHVSGCSSEAVQTLPTCCSSKINLLFSITLECRIVINFSSLQHLVVLSSLLRRSPRRG